MQLHELLAMREEAMERIAILEDNIKGINNEIDMIVNDKLASVRKAQEKDTGAVSIVEDGIKVTETLTKVVIWDQGLMPTMWDAISKANDDPEKYITKETKYKISEKEYKKWPEKIRAFFDKARTVKTGARKLEFREAPPA